MPADVPILMPEDVRWLDGTGAARMNKKLSLSLPPERSLYLLHKPIWIDALVRRWRSVEMIGFEMVSRRDHAESWWDLASNTYRMAHRHILDSLRAVQKRISFPRLILTAGV